MAAQDTRQGMYTYRVEQHCRTGSRCGCTIHNTRYVHIQRRATLQDRFKVWLHKTQDNVYTHTEESNIPGHVQSVAAQDKVCTHTEESNITGQVQGMAAQDTIQGIYTYRGEQHSRTRSKCGCTRHKTRYVHIQRRATFQDRFTVWLHKTQDKVCTHTEESNIPGQVRSVAAQDTRQGIYTCRGEKHSRTGSKCGCTIHNTRYIHIQRRATLQDRFKLWLHKTQDKVCTHTEESNIAGQVQSVAAQDTRQKTMYIHIQRRATFQDMFKVWLHKTRYVHIQRRATLQDRFKVWLHMTQYKVCTHTEESNIPGHVQNVAAQTQDKVYAHTGESNIPGQVQSVAAQDTRHKTRYVHIQRRATLQYRFKVWLHKTQYKVCTRTEESNIAGQVHDVAAQDTRHKTRYVHIQRRATLQDRFKVWLHKRQYKLCTNTEESNIPGQVQSVAAQRHNARYVHIQRRATFQDRFTVWLHKTQDKVCTHTEESNIPGQVQIVAAQDTRQGMYTYRGEQHCRTGSKCGCTRHNKRYVHIQRRATFQDRFKVWLHKTQDKVCTHT